MAKKRLRARLKRKKRHGMVLFISINVVNSYAPETSDVHVYHKKRPSFI